MLYINSLLFIYVREWDSLQSAIDKPTVDDRLDVEYYRICLVVILEVYGFEVIVSHCQYYCTVFLVFVYLRDSAYSVFIIEFVAVDPVVVDVYIRSELSEFAVDIHYFGISYIGAILFEAYSEYQYIRVFYGKSFVLS